MPARVDQEHPLVAGFRRAGEPLLGELIGDLLDLLLTACSCCGHPRSSLQRAKALAWHCHDRHIIDEVCPFRHNAHRYG
ncbi:hypothetical protein [Kibdelosporangium philippinense]|uniref:hypothetical protein n=1 Tax=Kibdelosporangium philippinense TaxID=211113 RepID=UPI00360AA92F